MTEYNENVSDLLPQALAAAVESYHVYLKRPVPDTDKEFKDYHMALKSCAAHIEHLLKLSSITQICEIKNDQDVDLALALQQAEREISKF